MFIFKVLNLEQLNSNLCYIICINLLSTVTSRLFTHIVSTEKIRKDTRDRKYTRGAKHTNYNSCFLYCF